MQQSNALYLVTFLIIGSVASVGLVAVTRGTRVESEPGKCNDSISPLLEKEARCRSGQYMELVGDDSGRYVICHCEKPAAPTIINQSETEQDSDDVSTGEVGPLDI